MPTRIKLAGYLKQRGLFSKYYPYYFILTSSATLQKYKTETCKILEEEVILEGSEIVDAKSFTGKPNCIGIISQKKSPLILRAQSESEFIKWVIALKECTQHSPRTSSPTIKELQALDALCDPAIISDLNCKILMANTSAEELFQYKKEELIGQNVSLLMPGYYATRHDSYLESYRQHGIAKLLGKPRDLLGKKKDGTTFKTKLNLGETEFTKEDGELTKAFMAVFREVESGSKKGYLSEEADQLSDEIASLQKSFFSMMSSVEKEMKAELETSYSWLIKKNKLMQEKLHETELRHNELAAEEHKMDMKLHELQHHIYQLMPAVDLYHIVELIHSEYAFKEFLTYCRGEHCEEALMFLKEAEEYMRLCDSPLCTQRMKTKLRLNEMKELQHRASVLSPSLTPMSPPTPLSSPLATSQSSSPLLSPHSYSPYHENYLKSEAKRLYEKYLKLNAIFEINISAPQLKRFESNMVSPAKNYAKLFEEIIREVLVTLDPVYRNFATTLSGRATVESIPMFKKMVH